MIYVSKIKGWKGFLQHIFGINANSDDSWVMLKAKGVFISTKWSLEEFKLAGGNPESDALEDGSIVLA